jgi:molecular chaperone DnaK
LSAFVLKKIVHDIEEQIGKIDEAVITIPANFAHEAREATMAAAKAAGLNVKYIINEPTAAALYYAHKNHTELDGIYAVYDLGGGTFDISIIDCRQKEVKVLATSGVSRLGGDDFDTALIKLVAKKYKDQTGSELDSEDFTKNDAEVEKKTLSSRPKTTIKLGKDKIEVSKEEFEEAISSLISQAEMLCEAAIEEADIKLDELKGVFLAGGSTRLPLISKSVEKIFKRKPEISGNVDEVVALGAAIYAAKKGNFETLNIAQKKVVEKIKVLESASKCFGTKTVTDNQERGRLTGHNSILIKKGDSIPCSITKSFVTIHDDQDGVNCSVTESETFETDPKFVKVIWEGELELPKGRSRGQEIKVTFSYDENQIMKCKFVDVATGKEKNIDLSFNAKKAIDDEKINSFLVE